MDDFSLSHPLISAVGMATMEELRKLYRFFSNVFQDANHILRFANGTTMFSCVRRRYLSEQDAEAYVLVA